MKTLSGLRTTREVICGDSLDILKGFKDLHCIITSLPDMEEIGLKNIPDYYHWMEKACDTLIGTLSQKGIIFFYQTNRKYQGTVIDKNQLITTKFFMAGYSKVFEKIVLRQAPDTVDRYRPTYTNLFAFSETLKAHQPTPDVIYRGEMLYKNAMGMNAIKVCLDYVREHVECRLVLDPFCGQGSVLKVANDYGYDSIGIDILPEQCEIAKNI
jgi:hypothetical protein